MFYGLLSLDVVIPGIITSYIANTHYNTILVLTIGIISYIILNLLTIKIFKYLDKDVITEGIINSISQENNLYDVILFMIGIAVGLISVNTLLSLVIFLGLIFIIYLFKLWKYNIFYYFIGYKRYKIYTKNKNDKVVTIITSTSTISNILYSKNVYFEDLRRITDSIYFDEGSD